MLFRSLRPEELNYDLLFILMLYNGAWQDASIVSVIHELSQDEATSAVTKSSRKFRYTEHIFKILWSTIFLPSQSPVEREVMIHGSGDAAGREDRD